MGSWIWEGNGLKSQNVPARVFFGIRDGQLGLGPVDGGRFPATNLNGRSFLVIFASGKDRAVAGAPLHANFSLAADGEYLGLFAPEGKSAVSEFAPNFPAQKSDVSFGLLAGKGLYFKPPSPGVTNSGGFGDWVDAPQFSQTRGFFETPFDLTLSSQTEGAVLRYTTNGIWPTARQGWFIRARFRSVARPF